MIAVLGGSEGGIGGAHQLVVEMLVVGFVASTKEMPDAPILNAPLQRRVLLVNLLGSFRSCGWTLPPLDGERNRRV